MTIRYTDTLSQIEPGMLRGFFEGWPHPPSPEALRRILRGSSHAVLALDDEAGRVVGFINAVGDGFHSAFIPLLEVLPPYRRRGIGSELVRRMLAELDGYYSIDLSCDPDLQPFYGRLGLQPGVGMRLRRRPAPGG